MSLRHSYQSGECLNYGQPKVLGEAWSKSSPRSPVVGMENGTKVLEVSGAPLEEPRWTSLDSQTPWLTFKPAENF